PDGGRSAVLARRNPLPEQELPVGGRGLRDDDEEISDQPEAARHAAAARPVPCPAPTAPSPPRGGRRGRQRKSPGHREREGGGRARTEACPLRQLSLLVTPRPTPSLPT